MLTTCDQRNNHASARPAAPENEDLVVLLAAMSIYSRQPGGREQDDYQISSSSISLNNAHDQDQEEDSTFDHPHDGHAAEYQRVCNIVNSVLEMIEDDDLFP